MVGVEGDYKVLDYGVGVCAVCADDAEVEVEQGVGSRKQEAEGKQLSVELSGKRVLVVGLGKSGLAAAHFLKARGARVTVSDARPATLIAELSGLLEEGFMVEAGSHGLLTFRRQDLIVVSPGVPMSTPVLTQVRAMGAHIIGELELGAQFLQGEVIAVTGSNGKTTTTTLIGEILKASGRSTLVGGNIGRPVTAMVDESVELSGDSGGSEREADPPPAAKDDNSKEKGDDSKEKDDGTFAVKGNSTVWSVLEVSSFQLETVETFKPRIALVLNITPDHLDRHGTFEAYAALKARITEFQTAEDFLVLNGEDKDTQLVAAKTGPEGRGAQIYWFSGRRPIKQGAFVHGESIFFVPHEGAKPEPVMPVAEIPLAGAHNVENVLAAVCAARLGGDDSGGGAGVQGGGASAGVRARGGGREVLQRFEGYECGRDDEGGRGVCGRNSSDSGR